MYVKLSVYGTQAAPGEYHMTKVDVTASSPVTKNGVSNSATLWKGTFGAGVGTKAGTMICSNLHFNHMAPAGSKYPYFTSWVDASTNKATSEGIDRLQRTDSYFEAGCKAPYIAGVTELKVTGSGTFNVPTGNAAATYDLGITPGVAYDCYGARWPVQNTGFTLDSVGKNVQLTSKDGKWYLVVNPDANAASDYNVGVRQSGTSAVKTVTIHTFDYNFSFVDAGGAVIAAQTVLPVIGVPLSGSVLDGQDALYSIVQMPPGIPVATVAINGSKNAAWLAMQIMANTDPELKKKLRAERAKMREAAEAANEEIIAKYEKQ
jgi:hypothetical protein